MQWATQAIQTPNGARRVLVVSPEADDVLGRGTLDKLKAGEPVGYDHAALAERVASDSEPIHCVILRGRGADGSGQFRMGRDLDDGQLAEIGYHLARAQLSAWMPQLEADLLAVARVELRVWELAAIRSGVSKLAAELDARSLHNDEARGAQTRAQKWVLEHALLNFGVGLDTATSDLLPSRLVEIEAARARR